VDDAAARDDRGGDPRPEHEQDGRVGAAQAAPAQLGHGGGLHVGPDRRAGAVEALAEQRRQLELLPSGHVGGERHTILVHDARAHRGDRHAPASLAPRRCGHQLIGARDGAIHGLRRSAARVRVEPVGLEQPAVEGRGGEGDLRAPEVDAEDEVALGVASGCIRHER
jgi:hypothetical protein